MRTVYFNSCVLSEVRVRLSLAGEVGHHLSLVHYTSIKTERTLTAFLNDYHQNVIVAVLNYGRRGPFEWLSLFVIHVIGYCHN